MKKILISIIAIVCILSCTLFSGCGSAEGTYKFKSMKIIENGVSTTISRGQEYDGEKFNRNSIVMVINKDKTLEFTAPYFKDKTISGWWEYMEDKKTAVLNVNTNGPDLITAEYREGKVYVYIYVNSIDYELVLS